VTPTILVVEDEPAIQELVAINLKHAGFLVVRAGSAEEGESAIRAALPDLVILDWMLPGQSGVALAKKLRADERCRELPIIMLTARGDATDRIVGLEMGADEYLGKPFNPRELLARIHAVLRRQGSKPPGAPEGDAETIRFSNIEVDLAARTLKRGDEMLPLTTGEFAVLKVLLQHPRQPLSRDKLMTLARGREQGPFDRAIDVQVSRLRKLLEADPAQPRYLQTVWGFGYVFVPDGATRD